jgi:hypothetical protein
MPANHANTPNDVISANLANDGTIANDLARFPAGWPRPPTS